ncbi:Calx-beta domain-containing protein [Roseiconus nitratireducens]|uniref:Calx-beta domain-containing protein n=1 Tax=Roseiconus nitratireducens TaxID=2605748 RepID=UPI001375AA7E|nr:Calx-beta domain-containing protein [Roseiconus nitratireducens]
MTQRQRRLSLTEKLEDRCLLAGDLDPAFGNGGIVSTEFNANPNASEQFEDVAVDAQGRVIGVGIGNNVIRYNADGSIDTTFGENGIAKAGGIATAVAVQDDGRIVVAGTQVVANTVHGTVTRLLADGSPDLSFDGDGTLLMDVSLTRVRTEAVVVGADGKISVVGTGRDFATNAYEFVAGRYLSDGSPDTTFGGDGTVETDVSSGAEAVRDAALQADGRLVVVGYTGDFNAEDLAVVRYDTDGSLDSSFSGDGIYVDDLSGSGFRDWANGVAIQNDGKIVVAGETIIGGQSDIAVLRLNANGTLDSTFGSFGLVTTDVSFDNDAGNDVAIQSDGTIVVAGSSLPSGSFASTRMAVAQYNSAGSLQSTQTIDIQFRDDEALAVALSGDKIVLGGRASEDGTSFGLDSDAAVVRLNANLSLDTTFDSDGIVTTALNHSNDRGRDIEVLPDGSIVAVGTSQGDFAIAKYLPDGTPDPSFSGDGQAITAFQTEAIATGVAVDGIGRIITVGRGNNAIALTRHNPDGSLDTTFHFDGRFTFPVGNSESIAQDVIIQPDGKIVVLTHPQENVSDIKFVLTRHNEDGSFDTTFGVNGRVDIDFGDPLTHGVDDLAYDLQLQSDGKIVAVGATEYGFTPSTAPNFAVARVNPDGSLDSQFGLGGLVSTDFALTMDYAQAVHVQDDGKILVGGGAQDSLGFDYAIARYNSDGTLDATFGSDGLVLTDLGAQVSVIQGIAQLPSGKIIATGYTNPGGVVSLGTVLYNADGSVDTNFGDAGRHISNFGGSEAYGYGLAVQGGNAVVTGEIIDGGTFNFLTARYATAEAVSKLTVEIDSGQIVESAGSNAATATITRSGSTAGDLEVTLSTSDAGEATLPATVTIPDGQSSTTVAISAVNDDLFDGIQTVTFGAIADGYLAGSTTVDVLDDDAPAISLSITPASIDEDAGPAVGTLQRNDEDLSQPLEVALTSSDPSKATVPATVTIPTGQSSVDFFVTVIDDSIADGDDVVTISAAESVNGSVVLDTTFDSDGRRDTTLLARSSASRPDLYILPDGSVLATSEDGTSTTNAWQLVKHNANGSRDTTFGTNGRVVLDVGVGGSGGAGFSRSITVQTDGKILVTGRGKGTNDIHEDLLLARYNADGSPDTSFATAGVLRVETIGGFDEGENVLVQSNGKIVVVGISDQHAYVGRFLSDGTSDPSFGSGGQALFSFDSMGIARDALLLNDDKIVIFGSSPTFDRNLVMVTQLTSDGAADSTFGNNGRATISFPGDLVTPAAIERQPDGKLLVGATVSFGTGFDEQFAAARFNADGTVDDTFGDGGTFIDLDPQTRGTVKDLIYQSPGRILLAGEGWMANTTTGSSHTLLGLKMDGSVDSSFGDNGFWYDVPHSSTFEALEVAKFDNRGRLVAIGGYANDVDLMRMNIASAPRTASDTLTILEDDAPSLTVTINRDSVSEGAAPGTATATVTRGGDTSGALTVNLVSSDTGAITVPSSVTIGAGQSSATIDLGVVDDSIVDGTQNAVITASASGFQSGNDNIDVTDDDFAGVTIDPKGSPTTSESGGQSIYDVVLTSQPTHPVTMRIATSDGTEGVPLVSSITFTPDDWDVPQTVTIEGVDDPLVDGDIVYTIYNANTVSDDPNYSGIDPVDLTLTNLDNDSLSLQLTLAQNSIDETGSTVATISRNSADLSSALVVSLSSSDTTEATVPDTVTIPVGESSVEFIVSAVNDFLFDGNQVVDIEATATAYTPASVMLTVTDNDSLTLGISFDADSISENGGTATGTVSRNNADLSAPLEVTLSSSDTTEATVPEIVTIPAGAASVDFTITGEDDMLVDGLQTVAVTASANGYMSGVTTLSVSDDDQLKLTLEIDPASISENGGTATVTVTRNDANLSSPLVVTLVSSDTSEATLPTIVTIPAAETFTTATVTGINDDLVDGTQIVQLTASASGYSDATANLDVTDDDSLQLTLSISAASISENGSTTGTVTRNDADLSSPLVVNLSSNDTGEATVPGSVTIEAGQSSADFSIMGVNDNLVDGTQNVRVTATATGYTGASGNLDVTDNESLQLTLSIDAASISENGGTATGTVSRNDADLSEALVVTLASNDTGEATVPATVTIEAGQSSADFAITGVNDDLVDGTQNVDLTATATGYAGASGNLDVTDDDSLQLTLSIDAASISENGGTATGTVSRNDADLSSPLVVTLASNDTGEATVPATVTIEAGQRSADFAITGVNDDLVDGTQNVDLTATATGYANASGNLDVTDDDSLQLTLSIDAASISENGGNATGTVSRNDADLSSPLVVTLASNDTSEATVPATVTIEAGQSSADFTIAGVNDDLVDGTQNVNLSATAAGYAGASGNVSVTDDDGLQLTLTIAPESISENGGTATGTVSRNDSDLSLPLTVLLSSNDTTEATVPTMVTIPADAASVDFTITGVDDMIVDGDQSVAITTSATGYQNGAETLNVSDDDQLKLMLSIDPSSISEGGGNATGIVTRNDGDLSAPLVVTLSSSDVSEATVQATVTIEVGKASASFDIHAVEDLLADGTQTVTVSATAGTHDSASAVVEVTDNDLPQLQLSVTPGSISENGGTATGTVSRNDADLSSALVVTLVSNDTGEATVPATVTIEAGQSSADFAITGINDDLVDGTQNVVLTATATGYAGASGALDVTDDDSLQLTLSIDPSTISESGGTATGTVSRNDADLSSALVVTLASNDTGEATVPATVTIEAGQSSADFAITGINDDLVDGTQNVGLSATATGYAGASGNLDVTDDDSLQLTLSIDPASISENGGTATGTVSRNDGDLSSALVVTLASNDTGEATVPATVTIEAGQSSADFAITGVNDDLVDGTQNVDLTATATGYAGASGNLDVTDDDSLQLTLSIDPASISENGGTATGTVYRNDGDLSSALVVTLASNDTGEATVPATVTIEAGQSSADFSITGINDDLVDGTQNVELTATATDYAGNTGALDVTDDDSLQLTLSIDAASISENGGTATGTVSRNDADLSSVLVVTLVSNDTGEATVPATVTIEAGQSSADFAITGVNDDLVDGTQNVDLTATATGYAGASGALDVADDDSLQLTLSIAPTTISENGGTATGTVSRNDADLSSALVVTLVSNDTGEATVPATVTIEAGQSSADFTIDGVNDDLVDGTQSVQLAATATGYVGASSNLDVTNDDVPTGNTAPEITSLDAGGISENGTPIQLSGEFFDPDLNDTHTIVVSWGDGVTEQLATAVVQQQDDSFLAGHVYATGGIYTITVTVIDAQGESDTATAQGMVSGYQVTEDGQLQFVGSGETDQIVVSHHPRKGMSVSARMGQGNGQQKFNLELDNVTEIIAMLGDGDDHLIVNPNVTIPVIGYGGAGDDHLWGGQGDDYLVGGPGNDNLDGRTGNDILLGGEGDDQIKGGAGQNLLIGGLGSDLLLANRNDPGDILVGGSTTLDQDSTQLRQLLQTGWIDRFAASDDYDSIVDDLADTWLRVGETVFDDGATDQLGGHHRAQDAFFATLDPGAPAADELSGDLDDRVIELF